MPYEIARHAGYCAGVRRAVSTALEAARRAKAEGRPCVMLGELIHNDQALEEFREMGVSVIARPEDAPEGAVAILRSHGEPPETYRRLSELGLTAVDTTCQFVSALHRLVAEQTERERPVLLLGDPKHPEIVGTAGFGGENVRILPNEEPIEALDPLEHPLLVAQTTYPPGEWDRLLPLLRARFPDLEARKTICPATEQRQQGARELAARADKMVVVGGRKSANTKKLYETCRALCPDTILVERAQEIPEGFLEPERELIGIAAGASTPDWSYKEVVTVMNETEQNIVAEEAAEVAQEVKEEAQAALTEEELNKQSFMEDIEKTLVQIRPGQTVTGSVVQVTDDEVCVNINAKSDGIIKREDLSDKDVKVGDEIEVEIVKINDGEGNVVLSQRNIVNRKAWEALMEKVDNGEYIDAVGKEAVKGGLIADAGGVRAFVPASHLAQHYVEKIGQFVGQPMKLKVIEVNKEKKRIVASRKEVLKEEAARKKEEAWARLEKDAVVKGIVRRFADFGAFVDLGGVDGLIHITDMAWYRIGHPSEVLKIGDEIDVKILSLDPERERIQLGYKQLQPKPWDNIEERYPVGVVLERKVVRVRPFGAFVELEPGVDGLVHISQCSINRVAKVEDALQPEQVVRVKVLGVDPDAKRISLSVKEALLDEAENQDFAEEIPGEEIAEAVEAVEEAVEENTEE
ncbi:MAG: bifunctional 4-hydroxy-3-methylbut-2-enyl diphosphate reductase/30S ribosomal protein S1 [Clostridia bacterium]|nr:bifunctional 4-hydroxy-3-methylbut-2-enyl diphosphate reductase/30S ribosomal protein S1 [Clostridia bacterium]